MGVIVAFDYNSFTARYPEFIPVPQMLVQAYWTEATIYCRNDGGGPIQDAASQGILLNMLTAHICKLNAAINGIESPQTVGRISNATEGSVSVGLAYEMPGTAAWYAQTKYGAAYWAATAPYRTMRYLPGDMPLSRPISEFGATWWKT